MDAMVSLPRQFSPFLSTNVYSVCRDVNPTRQGDELGHRFPEQGATFNDLIQRVVPLSSVDL